MPERETTSASRPKSGDHPASSQPPSPAPAHGAWQVGTLTGLTLLIGVPLGVAAGRGSWALFCRGLGIPAVALTPMWPVLVMVPAVIVIANAMAFWPGRSAAW
jgi:hypothetical protein